MRNRRRGFTLIEAIVALGVLVAGLGSVLGLITYVQGSNRSLAMQSHALDAFARIGAEIRDARCDFMALIEPYAVDATMTDPGLAQVIDNGWIAAPVAGSAIRFVGDETNNPLLAGRAPPIRVDYRVTLDGSPGIPAFNIDVRVREITGDAERDDPDRESGYWIRMQPVKKMCNPRIDETARGEF